MDLSRLRRSRGFTLIEIVLVLVLIGILAAVAVPKYFDLKDEAEQKAMQAIAAEFTSRFNGYFATFLLRGDPCIRETIRTAAGSAYTDMLNEYELKDSYVVDLDDSNYHAASWNFTVTSIASQNELVFPFRLPECSDN